MRGGTNKHTLDNILQNKECVIALVNEKIGQQMSLTSCNFDKESMNLKKQGLQK